MNTTQKSAHPVRYLFCILLSLLLLLSLFACSSIGIPSGSDTEESTASPDPSVTREPSGTVGGLSDTVDGLSYYVALVEELENELRELRAENFVLLSMLKELEGSETEASVLLPYTYEKDGDEITIRSYTGRDTVVTVPAEIDGLPVTEIGEGAFSGASITSVTLPASVEEIGWFAFSGCSRLTTLTASASVEEVGYGAFDGCPAALTLVVPSGSYLERYAKSFGIAVRVP